MNCLHAAMSEVVRWIYALETTRSPNSSICKLKRRSFATRGSHGDLASQREAEAMFSISVRTIPFYSSAKT